MRRPLAYVVLVAAAAGAILFWSGRGLRPGAEISWPVYAADQVRSVAVSGPAGGYVLAKDGDNWLVRLPGLDQDLPGDAEKVAALLSFMGHNRPLRRLDGPNGANGEDTGLGAPRARLAVDNGPTLLVGAAAPGDGVYAVLGAAAGAARPGNGQVLVLPGAFAEILSRPAGYYYDLRLLDVDPRAVVRVRLEGLGGEDWEVDRAAGVFIGPEPLAGVRVASAELDLYLHEALGVCAVDLAPGAETEGQDTRLVLSVWVEGAVGPRTVRVFARGSGDGPWLGRSSLQTAPFTLDRERVEKLAVSWFMLMDRRLVRLDPASVCRLRLGQGGRVLSARRDNETWRAESGGQGLVGIDMALWRLTELQYEFEPVPVRPDTARLDLTLELFDGQGGLVRRLEFFSDPAMPTGLCWIRLDGREGFHPVKDALMQDLLGRLPPPEAAG